MNVFAWARLWGRSQMSDVITEGFAGIHHEANSDRSDLVNPRFTFNFRKQITHCQWYLDATEGPTLNTGRIQFKVLTTLPLKFQGF